MMNPDAFGTKAAASEPESCPSDVVRIIGGFGSPYSNKVLAAVRYMRVPHRWIVTGGPEDQMLPKAAGPALLPRVVWGSNKAEQDSTPLLRKLSAMHQDRAVHPPHAGMRFLCDLVEDYADEWLTKAMYHYRWTYDPEVASLGIALKAARPTAGDAVLASIQNSIRRRQISRMDVVGSTPLTAASIEESFTRFIALLDAHLRAGRMFLFGDRPSAADFAIMGQLHPMISMDPNVSRRVLAMSPRVVAWHRFLHDLSGHPIPAGGGWLDPTEPLPRTLVAIIREMGRLYAPFMVAVSDAVAAGGSEVRASLDGGKVEWVQPTKAAKYQAKCLRWLREAHEALSPGDRGWVDDRLRGTGFEGMLVLRPRL